MKWVDEVYISSKLLRGAGKRAEATIRAAMKARRKFLAMTPREGADLEGQLLELYLKGGRK